jgi:replicative DNA helicase
MSRGITRSSYYFENHQHVIIAAFDIIAKGLTLDFTNLCELLKDRKQFDNCGGAPFISGLFFAIPTSAGLGEYLDTITRKQALRIAILEGVHNVRRAYEDQEQSAEVIEGITRTAAKLAQLGHRANKPTIAQTVMKVINDRQKRAENPRDVTGLTTYLGRLDRATSGLLRGDLRLICAPENTGKTILLLNELECVAVHHGMPALIIEMEMTREKLVRCMAASLACVDIDDERDIKLSQEDETKWKEAMQRIAQSKLTIECGTYTRNDISAVCRAWKANNPEGRHIAIDNLQIIEHRDREGSTEASELKKDAYALKALALELDVTISVASQQSGDTTKGSRGPAEAADMVLLLTERELKVKKSRSGGKGVKVPITIHSKYQRIEEREEDENDVDI